MTGPGEYTTACRKVGVALKDQNWIVFLTKRIMGKYNICCLRESWLVVNRRWCFFFFHSGIFRKGCYRHLLEKKTTLLCSQRVCFASFTTSRRLETASNVLDHHATCSSFIHDLTGTPSLSVDAGPQQRHV